MGLFRLAFRTHSISFFAHAHSENFELFFALIALIFVNRHIFISGFFRFNLKINNENVNIHLVIMSCKKKYKSGFIMRD
jgi:hypothetical protein